jgi:hypothetical protein
LKYYILLLSALISRVGNMSTYDFCSKYLYELLDNKSNKWAVSKCRVDYDIHRNPMIEAQSDLSAKDLAKIGLLFLNNGRDYKQQLRKGGCFAIPQQ